MLQMLKMTHLQTWDLNIDIPSLFYAPAPFLLKKIISISLMVKDDEIFYMHTGHSSVPYILFVY